MAPRNGSINEPKRVNGKTRGKQVILSIGQTPIMPVLSGVAVEARLDELSTHIRRINEALPSGWPIGLEQDLLRRCVCRLSLGPVSISSKTGASILYREGGGRQHLRLRPPSEVAARLLWDRLAVGPLSPADLLQAAAAAGGTARFRTGRALTTAFASGHRLEYLNSEHISRRVASMLAKLNDPTTGRHPILHAIDIYFDTLRIHPLPDGNGRLARILFQAALRQTIGLRAPILPLGPACAANRGALMAAYLAWDFDRNAQPLVDFIVAALSALIDLYERTGLKAARPPTSPPASA